MVNRVWDLAGRPAPTLGFGDDPFIVAHHGYMHTTGEARQQAFSLLVELQRRPTA